MPHAYPQAREISIENYKNVPTSPYVRNYTDERKQKLIGLLKDMEGVKALKFHQSLCPGCCQEGKFDKMMLDSVTYTKDGKVWIMKECPEHGKFKELYWSDYGMYKKAEAYQDPGVKLENPKIEKKEINCPYDCGLCNEHESHTMLGNVALTNRCDLSCWYCFFYAKHGDPVYEPSLEQIKQMLADMKGVRPVGANAVQLTGGEPTLREDLIYIVKIARDLGYDHVQLNTNGINLSKKPELCQQLRDAGSHVLYMSFDGVTAQTNPKNYWEAPQAIENCRKAGIGIVLVPTLIGGVNDHELGDIIRFGFGNIDTVRSVNFQPVSLVGMMPHKLRKEQRVTIPGAITRIEDQTGGEITRDDFFPIPCSKNVTNFIEVMKQQPKYRLSTHFACGMATYVFKEGDKMISLPQFFDVQGFFEYLGTLSDDVTNARFKNVAKAKVVGSVMLNIKKYVDNSKKPKDLKVVRMLAGAVTGGDYRGLEDFHKNSLFIGMMHFQDPYNWDIDRVHKCGIHYGMPDGRIIPFCTFNVLPELYRDKVQRQYSISPEEWEKKTGKKLKDDKHRRNLTEEQKMEIMAKYDKFRRDKTRPNLQPEWGNEEIIGGSKDVKKDSGCKGSCRSC